MPASRLSLAAKGKAVKKESMKRMLGPSCYDFFKPNSGRKVSEVSQKMLAYKNDANILTSEIRRLVDMVDQDKINSFEDQIDDYSMEILYSDFSRLADYLDCAMSAENLFVETVKKVGNKVDDLRSDIDTVYEKSVQLLRSATKAQKRQIDMVQQDIRRQVGQGVIELEEVQSFLGNFKATIDETFLHIANNPDSKLKFEKALSDPSLPPHLTAWARKKLLNASQHMDANNVDEIADMLNAITLLPVKTSNQKPLGMTR